MGRQRRLTALRTAPGPKAARRRVLSAPPSGMDLEKASPAPRGRARKLTRPQHLVKEMITKKLEDIRLPVTEKELEKISKSSARKPQRRAPDEEDTSESSSAEEVNEATASKKRQLTVGVKRRLSKYLDYMMEEGSTGLSVLERVAVTKNVDRNYLALVEKLESHLAELGVDVDTSDDQTIDKEIVKYMNKLWLKGVKAHTGNHLLAGWIHKFAEFSKAGRRSIPRSWRALKGWRRLTPTRSRKAFPLGVWAAVAFVMVRRGRRRMAIFVLMLVSTYARPSSLLCMMKAGLTRPTAGATAHWTLLMHPEEELVPSKTGEFDLSVVLDSQWMKTWISPVCEGLLLTEGDELWDFKYDSVAAEMRQISAVLGTEITLYQARHSGPSIDRALQLRPMTDVKKRGNWRSWKSVGRYEKSARLAVSMKKLTPEIKTFAAECERHLGAFMSGQAVDIHLPAAARAATSSTASVAKVV